ncbi:MAG TPA: hypothetical protein VF006_00810 [Longimicrobium sp.]
MRHVFGHADDMEVVGEAGSPVELLLQAGRTAADLAVVELEDQALPGIASHLLAEYPDARVLGVSGDARRACLYEMRLARVPLAGGPALLDSLRGALRGSRAEDGAC